MIEHRRQEEIALLRMEHEPANVLATEFCDALWDALAAARDDVDVRGVVLTGTGTAFSAGVDLFRVIEGDAAYGEGLLESLGTLFAGLRSFPKPVVAAINGHAIAGGAVMACACDYRIVAAGSAKIGLPELSVGVPFPAVALDTVRGAIPLRYQREALLLGRTYDPEAARTRGFVDEVVPADEVVPRGLDIARRLGRIPPATYALTKTQLARPPGGATHLEDELRSIWSSSEVHAHIREYLERTLGRSFAAEGRPSDS